MPNPLRDEQEQTIEPRVIAQARDDQARSTEPRLGVAQSLIILTSLVVFIVAGLSIPSGAAADVAEGGRALVAATIAVAAFVVAVVTFAVGSLQRR